MATKKDLIAGLNEDLNRELETVLRYLLHAATATGLLGHELREMLKGEVADEVQHAAFLADKIVALGGEIDLKVPMPRKVKTAKEMIEEDIAGEKKAAQGYLERIEQARELGVHALVIRLEDILAEEAEHAEELERLGR